jgi:hypothetical protein
MMMWRVKQLLLVPAVVVVGFAFGASFAGSAPAFETTALPEWSPESAGTAIAGHGTLTVEGQALTCGSAKGTFSEGKSLGTFRVDFTTCGLLGQECKSLGQSAELIEVHGEWHLVHLKAEPTHSELLLLFGADNSDAIHIECALLSSLLLLSGSIVGSIAPVTPHTFALQFETEGTGATLKQTTREFENNKGEIVKPELKGKANTGTERPAFLDQEEALIFMTVATTIIVPSPPPVMTALPEWSPPSRATATARETELSLEGVTLRCASSASTLSAGTRLGTFATDFKECIEKDEPCTGLGQTTGLIEVHGEWHLVKLLSSPLHFELLLLFGPDNGSDIHFECVVFGWLYLLWGAMLGLITPLTPHTAELRFSTEAVGITVKEANREYLNNAGENIISELKGKIGSRPEGFVGVTEREALLFSETATTIKLP